MKFCTQSLTAASRIRPWTSMSTMECRHEGAISKACSNRATSYCFHFHRDLIERLEKLSLHNGPRTQGKKVQKATLQLVKVVLGSTFAEASQVDCSQQSPASDTRLTVASCWTTERSLSRELTSEPACGCCSVGRPHCGNKHHTALALGASVARAGFLLTYQDGALSWY